MFLAFVSNGGLGFKKKYAYLDAGCGTGVITPTCVLTVGVLLSTDVVG